MIKVGFDIQSFIYIFLISLTYIDLLHIVMHIYKNASLRLFF